MIEIQDGDVVETSSEMLVVTRDLDDESLWLVSDFPNYRVSFTWTDEELKAETIAVYRKVFPE